MGILKVLFCFFIFPIIFASSDCQFSFCGNSDILIRFPFQLESDQNPYCGYPGFKLSCTNDSKTVLNLPFSGQFYVRKIDYLTQQIQLYDPDHCLPNRRLRLNLSGSPFTPTLSRDYTFFSCSTRNATTKQFVPIDCLSNSTSFVSAFPSVNLAANDPLPQSCSVIGNVSVPVSTSSYVGNISDELSQDLRLTWNKPNCRICESQGLMCGFESTTSDQVKCASDFQTGTSRGLIIFRIITLCIVGPASTFAIVMAICVCYKDRMVHISSIRNRHAPSSAVTPQPEISISTTTNGLDESTIESYEKLVLGESKRLPPGPNDGTCWICLSEYNSKETIRCIPECNHCFHSECIDEWLRMNSTCPVCRNTPTPSPSPAHHHHHHHNVSGDPLIG